ncbi:MAG: cytochrome c oxidase assembly factor Coa1 family protein [Thermogutta sp.]
MSQFEENPRAKDFDTAVSSQKSRSRGCLWIIVFGGILAVIGCVALCLGVFAFLLSMGREPYQMAVDKVTQDANVKEKLGEPIEVASWFPQGSVNVTKDQGDANLTFQIRGPNGKASVNVVARRISGKWGLTSLDVTYPDGNRQLIDVSGDGDAELDAPRWQPGGSSSGEPAVPAGTDDTQATDSSSGAEAASPSLDIKIPDLPQL